IACVVEVDDFLQAFEVTVVHIGLDEIGPRALVDIPQGSYLELAVKARSELRPIGIRIKLSIGEKATNSFIDKGRTCGVRRVSISISGSLVVVRKSWILWYSKIG